MDKNTTPATNDDKVKEALKKYTTDHTKESLLAALNLMRANKVFVPAQVEVPNRPLPYFIKNKEGLQFLAIYTSQKEIPDNLKGQAILSMPLQACNQLASDEKLNLSGIAVNPFSDNLILKPELVKMLHDMDMDLDKKQKSGENGEASADKPKQVKMNPAQFLAFVTSHVEFGIIPKRLFTEKKAFMDLLFDQKETLINDIFVSAFKEPQFYPFTEKDYSVMALNIADDLMLVRVDFPEKQLVPPLCYRAYIAFNPVTEKANYYTVEMSQEKDVTLLGGIDTEGKHVSYGRAPIEGSEMQEIIDLARKSEQTAQ